MGWLFVLAALVAGCTGAARWQAPFATRETLQVFDANGKLVGHVLPFGISERPIVATAGGAFRLAPERLSADGTLFYESTDCSGMPFMDAVSTLIGGIPSTLLMSTSIAEPGRTAYVAVPTARRRRLVVRSFVQDEVCYRGIEFATQAVLTRPITDVQAAYTPPFSIRPPRTSIPDSTK